MISSMTGYGRGVHTINNIEISVEIKSVNNRFLDVALKLYTNMGKLVQCASCHQKIGNIYEEKGEFEKALASIEASLKIHQTLEDKKKVAELCINMGQLNESLNQNEEGYKWVKKAYKLMKEFSDKLGQAQCFAKFGAFEFAQGNYERAMEEYRKALDIFKRTEDLRGLGNLYNNKNRRLHLRKRVHLDIRNHHNLGKHPHKSKSHPRWVLLPFR